MMISRRPLVSVAMTLLLALAVAACSDSSSGTSSQGDDTATTASEAPGTAKIASFDVPPSVTCSPADIAGKVTISYAVSGADRQEVRLDGRPLDGTDAASGTIEADFRCDGLPHDVVLVAYDGDGRRTIDHKQFETTTG